MVGSRVLNVGLAIVLGVTSILWFESCAEARALRSEKVEVELERDRLAADAVIARAEEAGWEVTLADSVGDLQEMLQAETEMVATLGRDLDASRVEVRSWMRVAAAAEGRVEELGDLLADDSTDVVTAADSMAVPFGGHLQGEILSGDWVCRPRTRGWTFDWAVLVPGELVETETGDGRSVVFARALHPQARFSIPEYVIERPDPVIIEKGIKWYWTVIAGGAGYLAGSR